MAQRFSEFDNYPEEAALDAWVDGIWNAGQEIEFEVELLAEPDLGPTVSVRYLQGGRYVRFSPQGMDPFYGFWQPASASPAPLLIHTPGYGAEMAIHPDLVMAGFNVLHINPLGYNTPSGLDEGKLRGDNWPVFYDTLMSGAEQGYRQWFIDCVLAVKWAQGQAEVIPNRLSFFGTSQGGGASLILGSIFRERGVRCVAADEPFMVNFPLCQAVPVDWWSTMPDKMTAENWRGLGFVDALSHARRLTVPVMLTGGGEDLSCPTATIESLFEKLPATRMYAYLQGVGHGETQQFIALATSWFRMYA